MQIDVSLDVFKALTERLSYDGQTYSDLIAELLRAESLVEAEDQSVPDMMDHRVMLKQAERGGFASRKLWLPHGTELRARYKNREYRARIDNNAWLDEAGGGPHGSPSAAARAITGTSVNGLRFWEARRPGDRDWIRLDTLSLL